MHVKCHFVLRGVVSPSDLGWREPWPLFLVFILVMSVDSDPQHILLLEESAVSHLHLPGDLNLFPTFLQRP